MFIAKNKGELEANFLPPGETTLSPIFCYSCTFLSPSHLFSIRRVGELWLGRDVFRHLGGMRRVFHDRRLLLRRIGDDDHKIRRGLRLHQLRLRTRDGVHPTLGRVHRDPAVFNRGGGADFWSIPHLPILRGVRNAGRLGSTHRRHRHHISHRRQFILRFEVNTRKRYFTNFLDGRVA